MPAMPWWRCEFFRTSSAGRSAPLSQKKWDELGLRLPFDRPPTWRDLEGPLVLLDGLLGSGSSGELRAPLIQLAAEMELLRQEAGARVAAVDLPSGIDPDSGEIFESTVTADVAFMIGNAKSGLLHGHAAAACGALAIVPVEPLTASGTSDLELIAPQTMNFGKGPRPFDFHKGQAGRVAVVAGSENYVGAAVLAATGALRGGAGLITLFTPNSVKHLIAAKCPPEIIVRGLENPREVLETRFDALVAGCGLGDLVEPMAAGMIDLLDRSPAPTVIDADALNLIARAKRLEILNEKHVLTPHPGEFARLAPDFDDLSREEAVRRFVERIPATLLLKGCRTIVARKGHPLRCNSTGTPAMATGGQGDLLAGVLGARLAFGESPVDAACLAAWVCGRSAEIAMDERHQSEESLTPREVAHFLGAAFGDWRTSNR
jgi:NAD(P)H-hydrate epimerase